MSHLKNFVYTFDELSEQAKDSAREWWRNRLEDSGQDVASIDETLIDLSIWFTESGQVWR